MAEAAHGVIDNADRSRFELLEDGELAFADYRRRDGAVILPHVEAAVPLRGKGAASRLMAGVAALLRERSPRLGSAEARKILTETGTALPDGLKMLNAFAAVSRVTHLTQR